MKNKNKYGTIETVFDIITGIIMFFGIVYNLYVFVWAILTLIFAYICKRIGKDKGIDYGFLIGWILGIIGLIIILVLPSNGQDSNNINKYEQLAQLQKLKENGTITDAEFEIEKTKLLRSE